MAKVFTITHGLENMGALKTGGQGSVYKGRRVGEIITAIKLLPTPIFNESNSDKNYRDFQNEVEKLKKVNREPNANVVKILSSGLSETGNFPFIEMEFIEGPDLEELLHPPHDPLFTVKEAIKVAEHLSNALAHCHKSDVKHGDIKSNNVKFNLNTGNYVLLDFGLAVMSDEQRRTSLRKAGAVEFMAPEQNEGETLFQTDVYSFGVIMFELLAGRVPFPLKDQGETARNNVRLAHMETLPPDLLAIRRELMPADWSPEKKSREMQVPDWLVSMIYKCLKKKPDNRFKDGVELHEFIISNSGLSAVASVGTQTATSNISYSREKELEQQVGQYRQQLNQLQREVEQLRIAGNNRPISQPSYEYQQTAVSQEKGVSKTAFFILLLLTIGFAAFSAYSYLNSKSDTNTAQTQTTLPTIDTSVGKPTESQIEEQKREDALARQRRLDSAKAVERMKAEAKRKNDSLAALQNTTPTDNQTATPPDPGSATKGVQYMVVTKAYFYNSPDESSKRNAFVVPSNNAILTALDEQDDFIYVAFTNTQGQTSKGWLRKQDLQQINE